MPEQEVLILYADVLAFLNFALDFLCLWISAMLASRKIVGWRMVLGALLGGVYAPFAALLGSIPVWESLLLHLCVGGGICLIAFPFAGGRPFFKTVCLFILTEAGMGGLLSACYYIGRMQVRAAGILLLAIVFGLAVLAYGLTCRRKVSIKTMKIEITFKSTTLQADLLVDSGNLVTEPFSALPVVILSSRVLPEPLNKPNPENSPMPLRAIPIRTGTGIGLLYGFIPDSITLTLPSNKKRRVDAVIGIDTDNKDFAGCDGLLPGALL